MSCVTDFDEEGNTFMQTPSRMTLEEPDNMEGWKKGDNQNNNAKDEKKEKPPSLCSFWYTCCYATCTPLRMGLALLAIVITVAIAVFAAVFLLKYNSNDKTTNPAVFIPAEGGKVIQDITSTMPPTTIATTTGSTTTTLIPATAGTSAAVPTAQTPLTITSAPSPAIIMTEQGSSEVARPPTPMPINEQGSSEVAMSPTPIPRNRRQFFQTAVRDAILERSPNANLNNPKSAAARAFAWLETHESNRQRPTNVTESVWIDKLVQRWALATLAESTDWQRWTIPDSNSSNHWLDGDECAWSGVECLKSGKVRSLSLRRYGLRGPLPEETLQVLAPSLLYLDLGANHLAGVLPLHAFHSFKNTNKLKSLRADHNHFSGNLFDEDIKSLTHLRRLFLENNRFSGSIPVEGLAKLSKLLRVDL